MKKPTELQQIQIDAIAKIEKHIEGLGVCPELATAKMSLEVNKRILYKLGFRTPKPKKVATQARKNPFKKKTLTAGEKNLIGANKIDNSHAPKKPFQKVELGEKKTKAIDNSHAPKDKFKKKDQPIVPENKTGPKFKGRLNKERKLKILELHEAGKSVQVISDELWIDENAIAKFLNIKPAEKKENGILLADNSKEGLDSFIDEVKNS